MGKTSVDVAPPMPSNGSDNGDLPDYTKEYDGDAAALAAMGYTQEMKRNFSVWSVLGVGFSLKNSWFGISAALITGINSGGPINIVYGIILISLISSCVGITLSELASAMPNAGGMYFWANQLAPKKYAPFASYLTGWFAWAGSIFTSASVALALGTAIIGCYNLAHPEFNAQAWHVFVAYQCINIFAFLFNCYGKVLPTVATTTLWISLLSFFCIIVAVPSKAPTHQDASFVFANFVNNTGWTSNGIAFIVGLVNTNWAFACLDCATHMAEEVHRPEKVIPIAIMGTVAIGFTTAWTYAVAMFFSMQSIDDLFTYVNSTVAATPILDLFYQAVGSVGGAIALEALILATGTGCLIASQTWQSRLCWSFARDNGIPFSKFLSRVHPTLDVPVQAHFASSVIVAILGCLYLGSSTAFNSMVTACIVLLYISYAIPVTCLLIKGRDNITHGPFWMGKLGLFANCVLLCWTAFTLVMYSFPYVMPVAASNMNYISAVYGVVIAIILIDWFIRGRKHFKGLDERREIADEIYIGKAEPERETY